MADARRRSSIEELSSLSLDNQVIEIITKKGKTKKVSAIHQGFVENRVFVPYKAPPGATNIDFLSESEKGPPQFLATASKEEWLEMMAYITDDLQWLLKLSHQRFWCQVIYDENLHKCLVSYLSNAPRYYDLCNLMRTSEMQTAYETVHRLIFLVYLRMSTYKESKTSHMNPKVFGCFVYDKFLFDIPILMDLCVLYGNGNRAIVSKMIENIFFYQPNYFQDLYMVVPTILQAFDSIERKLCLGQANLFQFASEANSVNKAKVGHLELAELEDIILYMVDTLVTLSAFLDLFSQACENFHLHQAECRIASFYETVFQPLEEELEARKRECSESTLLLIELEKRSSLAKSSLIKAFRDILVSCCVQPLLDSHGQNAENGQQYVEDLLQILSTCLSEKRFICDYESNFPFEEDLQMISQTSTEIDTTRTSFILRSIHAYMGFQNQEMTNGGGGGATEQTLSLSSMAKLYQDQLDEEHKVSASSGEFESSSSRRVLLEGGATASARLEGVELASLISHVQDMFPDLGAGFAEMCLEYYDYQPELVVNALLEESLPDSLKSIDRNLKGISSALPSVSSSKKPSFNSLVNERRNVFDNDEMDVFSRDKIDTSKVHKGKKKDSHKNIGDLLNDKEMIRQSKDIYNRYEMTSSIVSCSSVSNDLYEDEYDDTYDGSSVAWTEAPTPFDEIALGRKFTIPRVLRKPGDTTSEEESEDETEEDSLANEGGTKIIEDIPVNTNKNNFLNQDVRSKGDFYKVRGKPKGQGQDDRTVHGRKSKEQNKGSYANHNRKAQAGFKSSRGMMPR